MLGEIDGDIIEEFVIINGFISLHEANLLRLLHRSKVLILVKREGSVRSKSAESLISNSLLERSELEAALGD